MMINDVESAAHLSSGKKFRIQVTGMLYALVYFTVRQSFLGPSLSSWLKWIPVVLTLVAWIARWSIFLVLAGLVWIVAVRILYWKVKRDGYIRFLWAGDRPDREPRDFLADNEKVAALATGSFSVSNHEAYVLQRPAEYWRVPIGDHAIMVQHEPGKFLYQFVQAGSLQNVEGGYLIFGRQPQEALAITFLTTWGPEFSEITPKQFMPSSNHTPARLERKIYLTFSNAFDREMVWHNLLRDVGKPLHKPL